MDHNTNHIECPACKADLPERIAHMPVHHESDFLQIASYHFSDCAYIERVRLHFLAADGMGMDFPAADAMDPVYPG